MFIHFTNLFNDNRSPEDRFIRACLPIDPADGTIEHHRPLSIAEIKLQSYPLETLIPLIQAYVNHTGKIFSSYYNKETNTLHMANCPYTALSPGSKNIEQTSFLQDDLVGLAHFVKHKTGLSIKAKMIDEYKLAFKEARKNEYRTLIGLHEGINGNGKLHALSEIADPLKAKNITNEVKEVEVILIRPQQPVYREPAACINFWDEDHERTCLKLQSVLRLAGQWNDHIILEALSRFTIYSIALPTNRKHFQLQIAPGEKLREIGILNRLHNF